MFRSIRWSLLLWQAAILMASLTLLGAAFYGGAYRGRMRGVDGDLESAARAVVSRLLLPPARLSPTTLPTLPPTFAQLPHGIPPDWPSKVPAEFLRQPGLPDDEQPYFAIRAADGFTFAGSGAGRSIGWPAHLPPADAAGGRPDPVEFRTTPDGREVLIDAPLGSTVLVGRSLAGPRRELAALRWTLLTASAIVTAVGLAGGWVVATRATAPIRAMSAAARAIATSDLTDRSHRLPVPPPRSELAPLARTLNESFDRLLDAYDRQARFTADASHELRTPLAVIRSQADLALRRPRSGEEYQRALAACHRAAGRMAELVDSLLLLAAVDAGRLDLDCRPVDLSAVARDAAAQLAPVAAERHVIVDLELASAGVTGDAGRLSQVVMNLLSNAIRYNRDAGHIRLCVAREGGRVQLHVIDTGVGIHAVDLPRLFERFYRADQARSRQTGGTGLGLSICQGIVHAHHGTIAIDSVVGVGTHVTVELPAASDGAVAATF